MSTRILAFIGLCIYLSGCGPASEMVEVKVSLPSNASGRPLDLMKNLTSLFSYTANSSYCYQPKFLATASEAGRPLERKHVPLQTRIGPMNSLLDIVSALGSSTEKTVSEVTLMVPARRNVSIGIFGILYFNDYNAGSDNDLCGPITSAGGGDSLAFALARKEINISRPENIVMEAITTKIKYSAGDFPLASHPSYDHFFRFLPVYPGASLSAIVGTTTFDLSMSFQTFGNEVISDDLRLIFPIFYIPGNAYINLGSMLSTLSMNFVLPKSYPITIFLTLTNNTPTTPLATTFKLTLDQSFTCSTQTPICAITNTSGQWSVVP